MSFTKLFVVCLPGNANTGELTNILRSYAQVSSVTIAWRTTPQGKKYSLGYGFIICPDHHNAQKLLNLSKRIKYLSRSLIFKEFKTGSKLNIEKSEVYSRRIFVHNISLKTNNQDLGNFFSKYGPVETAYVVEKPHADRGLYGFVVFKHEEDAARVLSLPNCFPLNGHSVRIQKYFGKEFKIPPKTDPRSGSAASPRPVVEDPYSRLLHTNPKRLSFEGSPKEPSKNIPFHQDRLPGVQRCPKKKPGLNTSQTKITKQHSSFLEPSILKKVFQNHLFENLRLRTSTNPRGYLSSSNIIKMVPPQLQKNLLVSSQLTQPPKAHPRLRAEKVSKNPTFEVSLVKPRLKANKTYSQMEKSPKDVCCQASSLQSLVTYQEDQDHLHQKYY